MQDRNLSVNIVRLHFETILLRKNYLDDAVEDEDVDAAEETATCISGL